MTKTLLSKMYDVRPNGNYDEQIPGVTAILRVLRAVMAGQRVAMIMQDVESADGVPAKRKLKGMTLEQAVEMYPAAAEYLAARTEAMNAPVRLTQEAYSN